MSLTEIFEEALKDACETLKYKYTPGTVRRREDYFTSPIAFKIANELDLDPMFVATNIAREIKKNEQLRSVQAVFGTETTL